jgi:FkbM family methyltransferase
MSLKHQLAKAIAGTPLKGTAQRLDERLWQVRGTMRGSYSQHGEDRELLNYFGGRKGTYVDVGANYPVKISNTYLLYRNGWSGLTVEPIPRLFRRHQMLRPRDIQVNAACGTTPGNLNFYELSNSGLSTFDESRRDAAVAIGNRVVGQTVVPIIPLADLIRQKLPGRSVDLLSVDTEGFDMAVLMSNDWNAIRPKLVVFETDDQATSESFDFLVKQDYRVYKTIGCNTLMEDARAANNGTT